MLNLKYDGCSNRLLLGMLYWMIYGCSSGWMLCRMLTHVDLDHLPILDFTRRIVLVVHLCPFPHDERQVYARFCVPTSTPLIPNTRHPQLRHPLCIHDFGMYPTVQFPPVIHGHLYTLQHASNPVLILVATTL